MGIEPEVAATQVAQYLERIQSWHLSDFDDVLVSGSCPEGEYYANRINVTKDTELIIRLYYRNDIPQCLLQ